MAEEVLATFRYKSDSRGNILPVISFSVTYFDKKKAFYALIDSGAALSIFQTEVADRLGIDIKKGQRTSLVGIGGKIKGYIHQLDLEIAGRRFVCPVFFSHEYLVSLNLLGRKGFFEKFKITFEEAKKQISIE